jgi:DNA-directed RNA polymerase specialized sigma24 family protein
MLFTPSPTVTPVPLETPVLVDKASFQQFVKAQETAVYTFCFRMVGSSRLAENVAQKAFLDVCACFPAVSLGDVLKAARHRCREQLQHGDGGRGEMTVTDNQYLFNGLTFSEREVLALYYGCQLNIAEMATILNCSIAAVRATLLQARCHAIRLIQRPPTVQPMILVKEME